MAMQSDVPDILWRLFSSRRLTMVLLTAIAFVVLSGAILPQMPTGVAAGSSQYGRWYAEIRSRYLQWVDPLGSVGLFNVFGSPWLRLPLALLILNMAICALEHFEALSHWPKDSAKEFNEAFRRASLSRTFVISGTVKWAVTSLRALLEEHHYKVEYQEEESSSYLTGHRFSLTRWGTLVGHGGVMVAIVGLLLGGRVAWREAGIPLSPGQTYQIQHGSSLSVRLDGFQVELYPDGTPLSYRAQLTLLEQEEEVATALVTPNTPFVYQGIAFYQCSHGPTVKIRGLDFQGETISLQALVPGGTLQEEATLQLGEQQNEAYIAAPGQNLILKFVFHPHLPTDTGETPALLVQAYRGGVTDLVFSETLFGSEALPIAGNSYNIEWGHYAVLTIVRDPSFAPIMLGAVCLLTAAIITLYLPPRYIWAAVSGKEGIAEMRLVRLGEVDKGGGAEEFEILMGEIDGSL